MNWLDCKRKLEEGGCHAWHPDELEPDAYLFCEDGKIMLSYVEHADHLRKTELFNWLDCDIPQSKWRIYRAAISKRAKSN